MDDFQFILYIVFFLIYVVQRILKGNKKKQKPAGTRRPQPRNTQGPVEETESEKSMTFQDILKEIGKGFEPDPVPRKEAQQERPARQERPVFTHEMDEEITKTFQESVEEARNYKSTTPKPKTENSFKRDDDYRIEEENSDHLTEILKDFATVETAQKAVIYKEILDRKYF